MGGPSLSSAVAFENADSGDSHDGLVHVVYGSSAGLRPDVSQVFTQRRIDSASIVEAWIRVRQGVVWPMMAWTALPRARRSHVELKMTVASPLRLEVTPELRGVFGGVAVTGSATSRPGISAIRSLDHRAIRDAAGDRTGTVVRTPIDRRWRPGSLVSAEWLGVS